MKKFKTALLVLGTSLLAITSFAACNMFSSSDQKSDQGTSQTSESQTSESQTSDSQTESDGNSSSEHSCSFTTLEKDATHHWYSCECGEEQEKQAHTGGVATCEDKAECSVCDQAYGELAAHNEQPLPAVEATCTTTGLTAGSWCPDCETIVVEQEVTDKLLHKDEDEDFVCDYECGRMDVVKGFDLETDDFNLPSDHGTAEYTTEKAFGDEAGSLKVTVSKGSNVYLGINNAELKDISDWDYISFRVFNPTSATVQVGVFWYGDTNCAPGEWTEIKLPKAVFEAGNIDAMSGADVPATDVSGFVIRFIGGFNEGDTFYVSAVRAVKIFEVDPVVGPEVVVDFNTSMDLDRLNGNGYELSINKEAAYIYGTETGSLKVKNAGDTATGDSKIDVIAPLNTNISAYDYVSFRVYNATANTITVGSWWCADTNCAPGEWTEVKISKGMGMDGFSFDNMTNMKLRIISGLPAGGEIYISAVVAAMNPVVDPVAGPEVVVDFNTENDLGRLSGNGYELSINEEAAYIYGTETGSLKVKNAGDTATGDSKIDVIAPLNKDMSAYDYVSFRVYNATANAINVGTWWGADTNCAPGEWTEVKIDRSVGLAGCSFADMSGLKLRIISGLPAGGEIYISAVMGGMNPVAQNPELVVDFNDASDLQRIDDGGYEVSINTDADYIYGTETGSLKVKNAGDTATGDSALTVTDPVNTSMRKYDYVAFRVYNATADAISVGTWWGADATCAPGEWTEVKIDKFVGLAGCSFADMSGLKLRIISGLPAGGEIYISAVIAGEFPITEGSEVVVDFNEESDVERMGNGGYELALNTDAAYNYGTETGSLKITNAGDEATGDSQLTVDNPVNQDMRAFDYVVFRVYNATDSDITVGTWWAADTTCKAGEWTEVKLTYEMFKNSITVDGGMGNVSHLRIRIISGLPAGGSIYLSAVVGGVNA